MAGTAGVTTFLINSKFASGNLVFYEKTVGRTATGDVFTVGTAAVKVGGTGQDVDFQVYGTGSVSAIIDIGAATFAMVGLAASTDGIFTISNATEATSTTAGALVVTGGIAFAKDMYVGDDVFLTSAAVLNWGAGNALLTHAAGLLSFTASNVAFGVDATGIDVTFFGDTTAYKVWFDQNGDTNGAWFFGADDYGVDVGFYGVTTGNSMVWDASANSLVFVAGGITLGAATNIVLDSTTGTKIGTAVTQKLGFFGMTPSIQLIDARCDDVVDGTYGAEEAGVLDAIRDALVLYGLIAAA